MFLESNTGVQGNELEREFFILRKLIEKERDRQFADKGDPAEFYICTLSNKLIVYKVGNGLPAHPTNFAQMLQLIQPHRINIVKSVAVRGLPLRLFSECINGAGRQGLL